MGIMYRAGMPPVITDDAGTIISEAAPGAAPQKTMLIGTPAQKQLVNNDPIGSREQAILDGIAAAKLRAAEALGLQHELEADEAAIQAGVGIAAGITPAT